VCLDGDEVPTGDPISIWQSASGLVVVNVVIEHAKLTFRGRTLWGIRGALAMMRKCLMFLFVAIDKSESRAVLILDS
jgi:hypothetical protein